MSLYSRTRISTNDAVNWMLNNVWNHAWISTYIDKDMFMLLPLRVFRFHLTGIATSVMVLNYMMLASTPMARFLWFPGHVGTPIAENGSLDLYSYCAP